MKIAKLPFFRDTLYITLYPIPFYTYITLIYITYYILPYYLLPDRLSWPRSGSLDLWHRSRTLPLHEQDVLLQRGEQLICNETILGSILSVWQF